MSSSPDADGWSRLRSATQAAVTLNDELEAVTGIRDAAMTELHGAGFSYQAIAQEAGLTRGRVAQIVRRAGPAPVVLEGPH